jgi:nucleoside-diphosphate-sugar epimerase
MAAMLGNPAASGRAYNVMGEDVVSQVGFVELIADVIERPLRLVHVPTPAGGKPAPFGQNLTYDCHAVHTTTRVRAELGLRPRYTLAAGLAQTFEWYLREGLDRRAVDFAAEDALLRSREAG